MPPSLQPQTPPPDPLHAYAHCVREGKLKDDEAQRLIIARLQELYVQLNKEHEAAYRSMGLTHMLFDLRCMAAKLIPCLKPSFPRSIYIWGAVGRGKSLLMDMFYGALDLPYTQRVHFHSFMQEVHSTIRAWREEFEKKKSKKELLPAVALDFVSDYGNLMCLDELQVTDVADAMILGRLFTSMLDQGATFVITSNRPPEELYLGGLQREKFMDFVDLVYDRMDVLELSSPQDYRMLQIRAMQAVYMWPLSAQAEEILEGMFTQLTHHAEIQSLTLDVHGHKLQVPQSYGGIARFHFADLCEKPLGAADYLLIAHRFHTVFISGIPRLGPEKRNEAKRFVTLIDTLYDHRVKLICTAAAQPSELYVSGDGSFEFHRTASRLAEMQSRQYLDISHIP